MEIFATAADSMINNINKAKRTASQNTQAHQMPLWVENNFDFLHLKKVITLKSVNMFYYTITSLKI